MSEGGMVITVARYASAKGTAIHGAGVQPTVVVATPDDSAADDDEDAAAPKGKDPVLDKALELLRAAEPKKVA
jgi:C-terminal processing protease CtpA/Prc